MNEQIIYNGEYFGKGVALVPSDSRGLRYGDGCFETMKIVNGTIALKELHFERLLSSLELLGFDVKSLNPDDLQEKILSLAKKNDQSDHGRIRLTIFRSAGGLYDPIDHHPNYIIETYRLEKSIGALNENGLIIDVYKAARKAADNFSHIKSNSFLPYVMAADWSKCNKLNDAILLNPFDRIADATIANVFIVSDGIIKTPALTEGCIDGVMRKYLLRCCRKEGMPVEECQLDVNELQNASEVFLTNAIRGIKWVKQVGQSGYQSQVSKLLHEKFIQPLWR